MGRQPAELSRLLQDYLVSAGLSNPLTQEERHQTWREVAGEMVATHTRLAGVRKGVLMVEVDSAALMQELSSFSKPQLLAELQRTRVFGGIEELRFRLGVFE